MKIVYALTACLMLSGCVSGLFAGSYTETIATNPITGDLLINPITRQPIKVRTRTSKTVGVANAGAEMMAHVKPEQSNGVNCSLYGPEIVADWEAELVAQYVTWQMRCYEQQQANRPLEIMAQALKSATGGSDYRSIATAAFGATKDVERQSTAKISAFMNPLSTVGISIQGRKAVQSSHESLERVGVAAAENAGDINSVVSISSSATSSNDATAQGGGEGSPGNATAGGTADASIGETNVNVGRGDFAKASENAVVFTKNNESQLVEESATALQINGGNTDQATSADENNGDQDNGPQNGQGLSRDTTGPQ